MKKVTILIPVYNVETYLPKCLTSVLEQTYSNLQIVMIDDGSKDKSWFVMNDYAKKDSRIEIHHQENQGVSPTRNNLLDQVKGDYVLFVDSDDWIELDMVEHLVGLAEKYNSEFIMCDRVINNDTLNNSTISINILSQEQAICDFLKHEYFIGSLCNKLLSHRLLLNEKFKCDIWYGEDALFCWNLLQKTSKVIVSSKQLYHYRMNDESITHQKFGEKRLTGRETWRLLSEETKVKWPQYYEIAFSTRLVANLNLLQSASQSCYRKNRAIVDIQRFLLKNKRILLNALGCNKKKMFYALMIIHWYEFGAIYYKLSRLKSIVK